MKDSRLNFIDKALSFIERNYYVFLLIVLLVAGFNLFYNLNNEPIRNWDEARHGVNAYEMLNRGDFIVNTFGDQIDYYNLKPPLSYWVIMAGYKIAEFTPLGLRIFSALSALITIIITAGFVRYKHGDLASLIAAAVITTTSQYIISHCARTGDADSIFVLFFTGSMLSMVLIEKNRKWLYLSGLLFSLAFLAKSWHAGAIACIGGIYLLLSGIVFKLKLKEWLFFLGSSVLPILIWAVARFTRDGWTFFDKMISYDLLSRTAVPLEGHEGGLDYYYETLKYYYKYWLIIFALGFILFILFCRKDMKKYDRRYFLALFLWILVPFLLFTKAKTKLSWYIMPIYPPMAICIGIFLGALLRKESLSRIFRFTIAMLLLVALYKNERMIQPVIMYPEASGTQQTLKSLKDSNRFRGSNIYTLCGSYGDDTYWDQGDFLAAELYADLKPINGGLDKFITDYSKDVLLIIPKNMKYESIIDNYKLKIVVENSTNYILSK